MKVFLDGLYTKLTTSNTFSTAVGGRIYFSEAPQNVDFPFCVFSLVDNTPDWTFSSNIENFIMQISLYSSSRSDAEIQDMYTKLVALMNYKESTFSVTGYSFIFLKRVFRNGPTRIDDVWNCDVRYEMEVEMQES